MTQAASLGESMFSKALRSKLAGANTRPKIRGLERGLKSLKIVEEWALKDLNLRPTDYESAALTAELRARLEVSGYFSIIGFWAARSSAGSGLGLFWR